MSETSSMILLCGPDGAGKSTLARKLEQEGFVSIYGGKSGRPVSSVFRFVMCLYESGLLKRLQKLRSLYLVFILYPCELLEYAARYKLWKRQAVKDRLVIDRCSVDRLALQYDKKTNSLIRIVVKWLTFFHLKLLPEGARILFLTPDADTVYDRRPEFYKSRKVAESVVASYRELSAELQRRGLNVEVTE